jgi:hypothetical protein
MAGFIQRWAKPLPRHFQKPEAGNPPDLHPGAIHFQRLAQPGFHLALIAGDVHVDEINHHQPAQIAQPQLPGHFIGGFQIGGQRGFFDIAALGRAGRIDVNRNHRLGVINDNAAAGGQS